MFSRLDREMATDEVERKKLSFNTFLLQPFFWQPMEICQLYKREREKERGIRE